MKIKYEFVNGDKCEIEVSDKIGKVIMNFERKEENAARNNRRHEFRLDTELDNGGWLSYEEKAFDEEAKYEANKRFNALASLSDRQNELIEELYGVNKITAKEYAKKKGISCPAVTYQKKIIKKKLKSFLK